MHKKYKSIAGWSEKIQKDVQRNNDNKNLNGSKTPLTIKAIEQKLNITSSRYLADSKCSKGKLGNIINTIANENDWSNSLRTNLNKRYGTPNGRLNSEFKVFGTNSSCGDGLTPKNK